MPVDKPADIDRLGIERLLAREGEQPLGQRFRPPRAAHRVVGGALQPLAVGAVVAAGALQRFEIADDDREEIVEVVRDAAGQLADAFHLLRLAERSSAARRSVRSRVILAKPRSVAWAFRIALMTTLAQNRVPSLRTRQPSASYLPVAAGRLQRLAGNSALPVLVGIECEKCRPSDFLARVALDPLGPRIPVDDVPVGIEHEDRVIGDAFDQQPEAPLAYPPASSSAGGELLGALLRRAARASGSGLAAPLPLALRAAIFLLRWSGRDATLSIATAACAAKAVTMRSARSVNMPGCGWPKNRPPSTSPERDSDRHRQIAAHRQVTLRHAVVGRVLAVARIGQDVGGTHRSRVPGTSARRSPCCAASGIWRRLRAVRPKACRACKPSPSSPDDVVEEGAELARGSVQRRHR